MDCEILAYPTDPINGKHFYSLLVGKFGCVGRDLEQRTKACAIKAIKAEIAGAMTGLLAAREQAISTMRCIVSLASYRELCFHPSLFCEISAQCGTGASAAYRVDALMLSVSTKALTLAAILSAKSRIRTTGNGVIWRSKKDVPAPDDIRSAAREILDKAWESACSSPEKPKTKTHRRMKSVRQRLHHCGQNNMHDDEGATQTYQSEADMISR